MGESAGPTIDGLQACHLAYLPSFPSHSVGTRFAHLLAHTTLPRRDDEQVSDLLFAFSGVAGFAWIQGSESFAVSSSAPSEHAPAPAQSEHAPAPAQSEHASASLWPASRLWGWGFTQPFRAARFFLRRRSNLARPPIDTPGTRRSNLARPPIDTPGTRRSNLARPPVGTPRTRRLSGRRARQPADRR
jgi:hypothetical protein